MTKFSKKFLLLQKQINDLEIKLNKKRKFFQKECPHEFPNAISFTDCIHCGMSSYYQGQEE